MIYPDAGGTLFGLCLVQHVSHACQHSLCQTIVGAYTKSGSTYHYGSVHTECAVSNAPIVRMLCMSLAVEATALQAQPCMTSPTLRATTINTLSVRKDCTVEYEHLDLNLVCCLVQGFPSWQVLLVDIRCHGGSAALPPPPGTPQCCLLGPRHLEAAVSAQAVSRGTHWAFLRWQGGA